MMLDLKELVLICLIRYTQRSIVKSSDPNKKGGRECGSMNVEIVRTAYTLKGTFGVLYSDSFPLCLTLERPLFFRPDFLTVKNISCIPPGDYPANLTVRHRGTPGAYEVYQLSNIEREHRTFIQIHKGNYIRDTLGCILLGMQFAQTGGGSAMILNSATAFNKFMTTVNAEEITVSIKERCQQATYPVFLETDNN